MARSGGRRLGLLGSALVACAFLAQAGTVGAYDSIAPKQPEPSPPPVLLQVAGAISSWTEPAGVEAGGSDQETSPPESPSTADPATNGASILTDSALTSVDSTGYLAAGTIITSAVAKPFTGMSIYRASAWSRQATNTWCIGASTQMMINLILGDSDHGATAQREYVAFAFTHSRYLARAGAEVDGWANTLNAFGAGPYSVGAYRTFDEAMKAAATRMRITNKPVGLVSMEGHHAWVMAGFTSTGDDPARSQNFTVTSTTVMAPYYGATYYDPAPGTALTMSYMQTRITPYTDDFPTVWDGRYVIIQP